MFQRLYQWARKAKPSRPKVAIAAILRNEAPYVVEWLAWYRLLGVKRFYIYDNVSEDGCSELLQRLEQAGYIQRIFWPRPKTGEAVQIHAYRHALETYGADLDWLGVLDGDEFVVLHQHRTIPEWLKSIPSQCSSASLFWRIFGSAGHKHFDGSPVVQRFQKTGPRRFVHNRWCKSFVRPAMAKSIQHHIPITLKGNYWVDGQIYPGYPILTQTQKLPITHQVGQVNHYAIKSREEWLRKQQRGRAHQDETSSDYRRRERYFEDFDNNTHTDTCAFDRLPELQSEMQRINRQIETLTLNIRHRQYWYNKQKQNFEGRFILDSLRNTKMPVYVSVRVGDWERKVAACCPFQDQKHYHFRCSMRPGQLSHQEAEISLWGHPERFTKTPAPKYLQKILSPPQKDRKKAS